MRQAALQSHCDISNNMSRYGQGWINSQLNTSECCPTYKSIDGLQKANTESFHCITIPRQLSVDWLSSHIVADETIEVVAFVAPTKHILGIELRDSKMHYSKLSMHSWQRGQRLWFHTIYRRTGLSLPYWSVFMCCRLLNVNIYWWQLGSLVS